MVRVVILLALIVVAPLALIVSGYRDLVAASGRPGARGVLMVAIGVGLVVWLLDNITW